MLVRIIIVFLKFIVLHFQSVSLPSSRTCNNILNTSVCAFSISSKSITLYGFFLTASVNCHHSSCQIYPGGEPISLDTECFSIYSLISILIKAFLSLNKCKESAFAVSVLPTQVGPKNKKLQRGLFGSLSQALALLIAFATLFIALSCHTTFCFK